jgi:UDP-glucose 4-epimerase
MRILVTGGAGCLGSNLIEHWLPQQHQILVVDNFATGKREVVPSGIPRLDVVEGSIVDAALVERCVAGFKPEIIVHSAAAYKDPADWLEDTATNVTGSIHVARAAAAHGVKRIVNFQTALCYGRPDSVPIPITQRVAPFTSYGISKAAGEQFLMMGSVPVVSLRLANVTGPRLAIGPIPTFYKRLKAAQKCFCSDTVRDFLDMSDFLALMDRLIEPNVEAGVYNVSTGEGHTIKEIYDFVLAYLKVQPAEAVPIVPPGADDVAMVVLDPVATTMRLGWRAKVSFAETLRRQLEWYDRHGVSDVFSHLATPQK